MNSKRYRIEQDDINAAAKLAGCETITEIRRRLEMIYTDRHWWVYEGGQHVRLHYDWRPAWLARIWKRQVFKSVFFAVEVENV